MRYFRDEDLNDANNIINILADLKLANVAAIRVKGYESSTLIRARHFELWFAGPKKDTMEPSGGTTGQTQEETGGTKGKADLVGLRIEVFDRETKLPIAGAKIYVKSSEQGMGFDATVITSASGIATLSGVPRGHLLIQVTAIGFLNHSGRSLVGRSGDAFNPTAESRLQILLTKQADAR